MLIFTVVWPFVAVLLILLLAVAVLQERLKRRLAAPRRTSRESSPLTAAIPIESPTDAAQLNTAVLTLADTLA